MFVAPAHMRAYAGQQPSAFAETDSIAFRRKSLTTLPRGAMSDPRNVAHAKKVTQEKKHQKPTGAKKKGEPSAVAVHDQTSAIAVAVPNESATVKASPALDSSLIVLAKLKELEFHSRASLERLAELALTVEDELKQKEIVSPLAEVYSAQSAFQTRLTSLIEIYKAECDRMQGESG